MIYLDHHAATPLSAAAVRAMENAREVGWANPSSVHAAGRRARRVLEDAREEIAAAISAAAPDVVLTGGGTEACNLGVLGLAAGIRRVVTTPIEHPAVAAAIARLGVEVVQLAAIEGGVPGPSEIPALDADTLVAMQWVNHETGSIIDVRAWAEACVAAGARMFVDATQALGKVPVSVLEVPADALALAAHKIGGPAGAGALFARRGRDIAPLLAGGAQERGRRPGTPDAVAHAGLGAACAEVGGRLAAMPAIAERRDRLEAALLELGAVRNAPTAPRVATATNVSVRGWKGETLVAALDIEGVCASSGAACSSGLSEPSPVIAAMHPGELWRAASALRLSLGPETTDVEIEQAIGVLRAVLPRAHTSRGF